VGSMLGIKVDGKVESVDIEVKAKEN